MSRLHQQRLKLHFRFAFRDVLLIGPATCIKHQFVSISRKHQVLQNILLALQKKVTSPARSTEQHHLQLPPVRLRDSVHNIRQLLHRQRHEQRRLSLVQIFQGRHLIRQEFQRLGVDLQVVHDGAQLEGQRLDLGRELPRIIAHQLADVSDHFRALDVVSVPLLYVVVDVRGHIAGHARDARQVALRLCGASGD